MTETPENKYPKSLPLMTGLTSAGFIAAGFVQQHTWMFVLGAVVGVLAGVLSVLSYRPSRD
jgi:hypothetical protein